MGMSHARFAPMTASLLASKGRAEPSRVNGGAKHPLFKMFGAHPAELAKAFAEPAVLPLPADEGHASDAGPPHPGKPRRVMVAFTAEEYERLGIAAVKRNVSRHQLVREAMDLYFQRLERELSAQCSCLSGAQFCEE
jgi:hypothetical protein